MYTGKKMYVVDNITNANYYSINLILNTEKLSRVVNSWKLAIA